MIKCPECRHHISSMAKACPECGAPIDPEWAEAEAKKELQKLEEVPFTVEVGGEEDSLSTIKEEEEAQASEAETTDEGDVTTPLTEEKKEDAASPLPPEKANKSSYKGFFVAFVVLTGLIIGGLYYYEYNENQKRETRAYELLQDCSNPDFYEDFIVRFPKSKYIEEVRQRYKEVAAQQNEWLKLISNGSKDELLLFVRQHPTSPYVKVAQGRIDSLDWAEAQTLNTLEAVTHYIASHPNGYYIDHAETLRQTLERARAAAIAAAARDSLAHTDSATVAQ